MLQPEGTELGCAHTPNLDDGAKVILSGLAAKKSEVLRIHRGGYRNVENSGEDPAETKRDERLSGVYRRMGQI